jgi:hypothetical protein
VEHYNSAVGSFETRVLSTARKFEELKATPESAQLTHLEPIDHTPRSVQASGAPPAAMAALARASEVSARHQEPSLAPSSLASDAAAVLLTTDFEEDFTFVPSTPASARNAAADLRSAMD